MNKIELVFRAVFCNQKPVLRRRLNLKQGIKHSVDFDLADGDLSHYPQLLAPLRGTKITMPKRSSNYKRGMCEMWVSLWIKEHRLPHFYDDLGVTIDGHNYEPDLVYMDQERGIFIDIENDEPYTFNRRRTPTHLMGKDYRRNQRFNKAGWIVLRFSEIQFLREPERVVRTVMDVVRDIAPDVEMPKALENVEPVEPDSRWDYNQARDYIKRNYRINYMKKHIPFFKLACRLGLVK